MLQAASLRRIHNHPQPPNIITAMNKRRDGSVTTREQQLTWWALHIKSKSCLCRNLATTSAPKVKLTPRSFSPQPIVSLSGSDQRRSQRSPWSGTSVGRMIRRICSMLWRSGLRPPWQQKIFSSTIAATGRQLKQSVKVFHNLMLYLRLPRGGYKLIKLIQNEHLHSS